MRTLLRVSRIRDPRFTLWSSVLLLVAFLLFGAWVESSVDLKPTAQTSFALSKHLLLHCPSNPAEPVDASTDKAHCAVPTVPENVC